MKRFMGRVAISIVMLCLAASAAQADGLRVKDAWVRLPPPAVNAAAAYMTIYNDGNTDMVITSVHSDVAENTSFHRMSRQGAMMQMERVTTLAVPAHGKLTLATGGMHVMLDGLKRKLRAGESVRLTLHTAAADILTIDAPVRVRSSRSKAEPGAQLFSRAMALMKANDTIRAASLLERAARQGNRRAQYQLGLLFARGDGVNRDLVRARALFRKAAMQGHPKAQFYLGQMYAFGDGGKKDNVTATMWFWLATTLGDRYARDSLRVMTGKITPVELTEAKRRAKLLWQKMPHDMKIKRSMAMH